MAHALGSALMALVVASLAAFDSPAASEAPAPSLASAQASAAVVTVAVPEPGRGEVPWCSDADDPRCSRDEPGLGGGGTDSRTPVTTYGLERPETEVVEAEPQSWGQTTGLSPSAGVLPSVERPPQRNRSAR